jgi:hypothetical protein
MTESKYGKYVITDMKKEFAPEVAARYAKWATRILWLDEEIVEGAYQMNCSWYRKMPEKQMEASHTHDADEIIGFFGSDPENANDLNGEIEFWIEDEKFNLTKSTLIFVPAGVKHCPLIIRKINKPIFHFTTVKTGLYKPIGTK